MKDRGEGSLLNGCLVGGLWFLFGGLGAGLIGYLPLVLIFGVHSYIPDLGLTVVWLGCTVLGFRHGWRSKPSSTTNSYAPYKPSVTSTPTVWKEPGRGLSLSQAIDKSIFRTARQHGVYVHPFGSAWAAENKRYRLPAAYLSGVEGYARSLITDFHAYDPFGWEPVNSDEPDRYR